MTDTHGAWADRHTGMGLWLNENGDTQCLFQINWDFPMNFSSLSPTRRTCNELIWFLISAIHHHLEWFQNINSNVTCMLSESGMCISDQNAYLNSIETYFHFQIAKCTQWNTFEFRNEENAKGNDERNVHLCCSVLSPFLRCFNLVISHAWHLICGRQARNWFVTEENGWLFSNCLALSRFKECRDNGEICSMILCRHHHYHHPSSMDIVA